MVDTESEVDQPFEPDNRDEAIGMPAKYRHCLDVYDVMESRCEHTPEGVLFEGSLTNVITQELALGNAYYTQLVSKLKDMGCIEMLRRGGGPSPSVWLLKRRPTVEAYNTADKQDRERGHITKADKEILKQRQVDLERRITKLEDILRGMGAPV
jgi:hypothetical protein